MFPVAVPRVGDGCGEISGMEAIISFFYEHWFDLALECSWGNLSAR
jgi:hypothetical protein